MSFKQGNTDIRKHQFGNSNLNKIYFGNTLVLGNNLDTGTLLDGMIGAWAFEVNGTVDDLIGTVTGSVQDGTTLETGANGNAIGLDTDAGVNGSWIDFGDPVAYENMTACTIMIDFYPTANGEASTSNIFGNLYTTTGGYIWHLGWTSGGNIRGRITASDEGANADIISSGTYALNTWHRIVLRWEGGGFPPKITVDGGAEEVGSESPTDMRNAGDGMSISMDGTLGAASTRQITGYVDNAFVWDRYLTDAEMAFMFDGNPSYAELI